MREKHTNPISDLYNRVKLQRKEKITLSQLVRFIHENTQRVPSSPQSRQVKDETKPKSDQEAAKLIQKFWRRRLATNEFFSEQGREVYDRMLERQDFAVLNTEANLLATMLYGKTVAAVRDYSSHDFPVERHEDWPDQAFYHRDDNIARSSLVHEVVSYMLPTADFKNKTYITTINVNNGSVKDVLERFLTPEQMQSVIIHSHPSDPISVVELDNRNPMASEITMKIQSAGLIASPVVLAQIHSQIKSRALRELNPGESEPAPGDTIDALLAKQPKVIKDVKKGELMVQLSQIAVGKSPNKYLAACLYRMIDAIPEYEMSSDVVRRISLFLDLAVTFYKNNYERFAFAVYSIAHEIGLFITDAMKKGELLSTYANFKKTIEQQNISSFGMTGAKDNYTAIAAPAVAGTHAFIVAMDLARKMQLRDGREPSLQVVGSNYFEFNKFFSTLKREEGGGIADIYHISSGPIVNPEGITPGTDINIFIRNKILRNQVLSKPVSIVVDVTTGLHKNLQLDDDIKKLVEEGKISIICYESYQKSGLAHTDQVQGGVVYGVCSKDTYSAEVLSDFEAKAKRDLETHADMAIASYMHEHSGEYIEKIKEQHFKNGALFRSFFTSTPDYATKELHYDEMLQDLNELYFFLIIDNQFMKAASAHFSTRDSFGHFHTSLSSVGHVSRLSPNASDNIDTLIQITQLHFTSQFSRDQLFGLLNHLLDRVTSGKLDMNQDYAILFLGLLSTLQNLSNVPPKLKSSEEYQLLLGSKILAEKAGSNVEITGRNTYQTVMSSLYSTKRPSSTEGQQSLFTPASSEAVTSQSLRHFLRNKYSPETALQVLAHLNKLDKLEHNKGKESPETLQQKAILIVLLEGWGKEQIPGQKKNLIINSDFIKNNAEVIITLKNHNLLTKDLLLFLVANRKSSHMGKAIIRLANEGLLKAQVLPDLKSLNNFLKAVTEYPREKKMTAENIKDIKVALERKDEGSSLIR